VAKTVTIDISLDIAAQPPFAQVRLTSRNKTAANGDTIKWQKRDDDDSFEIISLEVSGPGEAFSTPTLQANGKWLKSDFSTDGAPAGTAFPYTLTVRTTTAPETDYDTTVELELVEDKPVIRN